MRRLLAPQETGTAGVAVLALAAIVLGVAGVEHGRLFHRGYGDVAVVGPLFFLNTIATAVAILALLARRVVPFMLAAIVISAGALVSIVISHTSSFFAFSEATYDTPAKLIIIAEAASLVLVLIAIPIVARSRPRGIFS